MQRVLFRAALGKSELENSRVHGSPHTLCVWGFPHIDSRTGPQFSHLQNVDNDCTAF